MVKNTSAVRETWVGKIPWRREWQPTRVFLPGESHGQRSLEGYTSWGHNVRLSTVLHMYISGLPRLVKNLLAVQETLVQSLGTFKDP